MVDLDCIAGVARRQMGLRSVSRPDCLAPRRADRNHQQHGGRVLGPRQRAAAGHARDWELLSQLKEGDSIAVSSCGRVVTACGRRYDGGLALLESLAMWDSVRPHVVQDGAQPAS